LPDGLGWDLVKLAFTVAMLIVLVCLTTSPDSREGTRGE
jgi:hypothetical protein